MHPYEKLHRKYGGYPWFAWWPVRLESGSWAWLKTVWRYSDSQQANKEGD